MKIVQHTLVVETVGKALINLQRQVQQRLEASELRSGLCTVFVRHTSASLVLQENADPAVLRDLERWISELASESRPWEHDDEGPDDMPAHARTALTSSSQSIPFADARLLLGTWQGIFLWEHRATPHRRSVIVHLMGE